MENSDYIKFSTKTHNNRGTYITRVILPKDNLAYISMEQNINGNIYYIASKTGEVWQLSEVDYKIFKYHYLK